MLKIMPKLNSNKQRVLAIYEAQLFAVCKSLSFKIRDQGFISAYSIV